MVRQTAGLGLLLSLLLVAVFAATRGPAAAVAAGTFGGLATVLQVIAVALVARPIDRETYRTFLKRWGMGVGLRLLGVAAIPVAVAVAREQFPPLPSALGYLGVVVPLLFFEARLFR